MSEFDELERDETYVRNSKTRYRCEECGYKWQVKDAPTGEESEEADDTVYYDGEEEEPSTCPMCGCSDILTL